MKATGIWLCEDSIEGIFSGVYDVWKSRGDYQEVHLELKEGINYSLFTEYHEAVTDGEKAWKVADTIYRRLGAEDYHHIFLAALSKNREKTDSIYQTTLEGLAGHRRGSIMYKMQNRHICKVFELSRKTGNEAHRYIEFIRFRELKNGILFTEIKPENQILSLLGNHFADRFPGEHFMIYDGTHQLFLVHEAFRQWHLVSGERLNRKVADEVSEKEEDLSKLWKGFCSFISIEERKNLRLQQQFLPQKFRPYMTEMK